MHLLHRNFIATSVMDVVSVMIWLVMVMTILMHNIFPTQIKGSKIRQVFSPSDKPSNAIVHLQQCVLDGE